MLSDDTTLMLSKAVARLADSIDHLAGALQAPQAPQRPAGPPGGNGGAPVAEDPRIKKSKKVFAICAKNKWQIDDIGQRATGRDIGADSRKWSMEDLDTVLDTMKEWGEG